MRHKVKVAFLPPLILVNETIAFSHSIAHCSAVYYYFLYLVSHLRDSAAKMLMALVVISTWANGIREYLADQSVFIEYCYSYNLLTFFSLCMRESSWAAK